MRQRRPSRHPPDNIRNPPHGHVRQQHPRRLCRILGRHQRAHHGDAVEALCRRGAGLDQHGRGVGAVDAADADGGDGGVVGGGEGREDGADAGCANDGFCVFFAASFPV